MTAKRISCILSLLLAAAAIFLPAGGCIRKIGPAAGTDMPETSPAPVSETAETVDEEVLSEALALALVGWGTDYLNDPNGLWSVIGYYAALTARMRDPDERPWISARTADCIASVLRLGEDPLPEPSWLDGGESAKKENKNGVSGIAFPGYGETVSSMLGIWRALHTENDNGTWIVTVEDHLDDGVRTCLVYAAFEDAYVGESKVRGMPYLYITEFLWADDFAPDPDAEAPPADREHLAAANAVETLVLRHGGYLAEETSYYADPPLASRQYLWADDPGILSVFVQTVPGEDGTLREFTNYSFWDGAELIAASVEGRGIVAGADWYPGKEPADGTFPGNDQYYYDFPDTEYTVTEEADGTVTIRSAPFGDDGRYFVCTADRKTLSVLEYRQYGADGNLTYERRMTYGRENVKEFISPAIGNIRDVRNVQYNVRYFGGDGEETESRLFFHVPRAWEFSLSTWMAGEMYFYADENYSRPVENLVEPGEGDLVFWVTDAAG